MLEVRNQTGGLIEVFEMRVEGDRYLGAVSPGTQNFEIDNVADPAVTYLAHRPGQRGTATTITWRARRTRASGAGIELTLRCRAAPG